VKQDRCDFFLAWRADGSAGRWFKSQTHARVQKNHQDVEQSNELIENGLANNNNLEICCKMLHFEETKTQKQTKR
jgi:hypothetical protein